MISSLTLFPLSNTIFLVRHLGYADVAILLLGFLPANFLFVGGLDTKEAFNIICTVIINLVFSSVKLR